MACSKISDKFFDFHTLYAQFWQHVVQRERALRGAGKLTMNFGRGKNLQPAKIFRARLSTPHLAKPMLCDVLSFPIIFRFFVSIKLIIFSFRMENLRLNPKKFSENVLRNFFANFMHTFEIFTHFNVILSRCGFYGVFPKMVFRRNF